MTQWLRSSRRLWLATACLSVAALSAFAVTLPSPDLTVRLDGDTLRINLPNLDFLSGKPLDRLKDGSSVAFIGQLTVTTAAAGASRPAARSVARFALSYDIWEERYSVTRIGQMSDRRSASHLSRQAAQAWCLDNLTLDRSQLPAQDFWVQLDLRAEDPRDQSGVVGDPGINLTRLIEIFGRPARGNQPRWLLTNGPYRLFDLPKADSSKSDQKGPRP